MNRIERFDNYVPASYPIESMEYEKVQALPVWSHVKPTVKRSESKTLDTSSRPVLERPVSSEPASKEPLEFEDPEIALLKALFSCQKTQRENREKDGLLSATYLKENISLARQLKEKGLSIIDDISSNSSYAYLLGWAKSVLNAAMIAGALVSAALLIFTGGATLPPMLVAAEAFAAVSSGVVTATKSVMDYQRDLKEGERQELQMKQMFAQERIQKSFKEIQEAEQAVANNWSQLREILDNIYQATKSMRS